MRRACYIPIIIAFLVQCSDMEPDRRESYIEEYFCFDGYRGIGVVSIPDSVGSYDIPAFVEPNEEADRFASFMAEITGLTKSFTIEGGRVAEDAFFEFSYEHFGVPVEFIQGDWIKVRLGYDANGAPVSGWIRYTSPLVLETWDTFLPRKALFLATCDKPVLYKSPDGETFVPETSHLYDDVNKTKRPDYRIKLLEIDGDWIKVQFVTPSDYCREVSSETEIIAGWVRLLRSDKSPAVWFHTRGC